jgi:hypothetical protein
MPSNAQAMKMPVPAPKNAQVSNAWAIIFWAINA